MQPKKATIRSPRSPCWPTAASSRRACVLLTTVRGSTVLSVRGRVHLTALSALAGRTPVSTAYCIKLFSTARFRLAVFAAAAVPSCLRLIRLSSARQRAAPVPGRLRSATGRAAVCSQRTMAARSLGWLDCAAEPVAERPRSQGAADLLDGIRRLVAGEHCLGGVGERFGDGRAVVGRGVGPLGCGVVKGQGIPADGGLLTLPGHRAAGAEAECLALASSGQQGAAEAVGQRRVAEPFLPEPVGCLPSDLIGRDLGALVYLGAVDADVVGAAALHQAASSRDASQR